MAEVRDQSADHLVDGLTADQESKYDFNHYYGTRFATNRFDMARCSCLYHRNYTTVYRTIQQFRPFQKCLRSWKCCSDIVLVRQYLKCSLLPKKELTARSLSVGMRMERSRQKDRRNRRKKREERTQITNERVNKGNFLYLWNAKIQELT